MDAVFTLEGEAVGLSRAAQCTWSLESPPRLTVEWLNLLQLFSVASFSQMAV